MKSCRQCKKDYRHSLKRRGLKLSGAPYPPSCFHDERTALCAKHHPKSVAYRAKRRADQLQQTPPWADHTAIKAIYAECAEMNRAGGRFHVDHIIPLRGKHVRGLHVETNLQILPARENIRKGNRV